MSKYGKASKPLAIHDYMKRIKLKYEHLEILNET